MIKLSNIITSTVDLSNIIANSAEENGKLLSVYDDEIKPKLRKIINQHSIAGIFIGPLPTMGIATTINLVIMYGRLSKVLSIPIVQEFDKLISPVISSVKWAFIKYGAVLAAFKIFITGLDFSGVGLPVGVIGGALGGYFFSNQAGSNFAKNIADFFDKNFSNRKE